MAGIDQFAHATRHVKCLTNHLSTSHPGFLHVAPQLRKAFRTKVFKKSAAELAAEQFASGNKSLLSGLRKARFQRIGRRLSQSMQDAANNASAEEGGKTDTGTADN